MESRIAERDPWLGLLLHRERKACLALGALWL